MIRHQKAQGSSLNCGAANGLIQIDIFRNKMRWGIRTHTLPVSSQVPEPLTSNRVVFFNGSICRLVRYALFAVVSLVRQSSAIPTYFRRQELVLFFCIFFQSPPPALIIIYFEIRSRRERRERSWKNQQTSAILPRLINFQVASKQWRKNEADTLFALTSPHSVDDIIGTKFKAQRKHYTRSIKFELCLSVSSTFYSIFLVSSIFI